MTTLFYEQNTIARVLLYLLILSPLAGYTQQVSNTNGLLCETSTTWNGTAWSNGTPDATKNAIFSGSYTCTAATFHACSLTVDNGVHVNFTQNSNAIIVNSVDVANGGHLVFESGSNLIQVDAQENTGDVTIKRNSSLIKKDDYTLWSSPVSGQVLHNFSPETLTNRFYSFLTTDNIYVNVPSPSTTSFEKATGYLIRTGENHPLTPTIWEGSFEGVPNTGNITLPLVYVNENDSYNAVGNPYPSPISIVDFIDANSNVMNGTIWLWRKTDDNALSSYAVVTKFGYLSNSIPDPENGTIQNPFALYDEGILNTGQGFLVQAENSNDLVFNNDMRVAVSSGSFFRTDETILEKDSDDSNASRFWINVTSEHVFSQVLIGYMDGATTAYNKGWDGEALMDGTTTLYSIADNKKLAIQARPAFEIADTVPLGFKTAAAGTFTISLDHLDGLFTQGQHVYIKDSSNNSINDLNQGAYTFTSAAGTFENRFTVVYSTTLGTEQPDAAIHDVIVYSNSQTVKVKATEEITAVAVYDLLGRNIFKQDNINSSEFSSNVIAVQAPVIVTITLANGVVVSKKIIVQ